MASVSSDNGIEVLMRPLHNGSVAVGLFNRTATPEDAQFARSSLPENLRGKGVKARDLWQHESVTIDGDAFKATVPSHGVVLLRISARTCCRVYIVFASSVKVVSPAPSGMTFAPASTVVFADGVHCCAPGLVLVCSRRIRAAGTGAVAGARCNCTVYPFLDR